MELYLIIFTNGSGEVGPEVLVMHNYDQAMIVTGYPEFPKTHVFELTIGQTGRSGYDKTGVGQWIATDGVQE